MQPSPVFEYWDGRGYVAYGDVEQRDILAALSSSPRRPEVWLQAPIPGQYLVRHLEGMERGVACQVNVRTSSERHVRVRAPYRFQGEPPDLDLKKLQFQCQVDHAWLAYPESIQSDLALAASCTPTPELVMVSTRGHEYYLTGLPALLQGPTAQHVAVQTNYHSKQRRSVRLAPRPASLPSRGFSMAALRLHVRHADGSLAPLADDAAGVVLEAWRRTPRPSPMLPSGHRVEGFEELEAGEAGCRLDGGEWLRLELSTVSLPGDGRLDLPRDSETDDQLTLAFCGHPVVDVGTSAVAVVPAIEGTTTGTAADSSPSTADSGSTDGALNVTNGSTDGALSANRDLGDGCLICLGDLLHGEPKFRLTCGHIYHSGCLGEWFQRKRACPKCSHKYGKLFGHQPATGASMTWALEQFALPGHQSSSSQTFVINFNFSRGTDNGGMPYAERSERCFLPGNAQGAVLLELYKVAFRRRVMFGLGTSMARGVHRPTFNIHIKTNSRTNSDAHGYPDPDYFKRCLEELHANGVNLTDLP